LPADEVIGQAGRCLKRPERNSAMLSVKVFQEGEHFGWTLNAPSNELLGHGTAETEQKARIDALDAGMTYIDRAKERTTASRSALH
jgi:hypothetical protein